MAINTAWVKSHWYYIAAGVFGLIVLYELVKNLGGGASGGGSSATAGTPDQYAALQTAADAQNAQVNAATTLAAYQASTANNQIAAALELGKYQTDAQLQATNNKTEAAREIGLSSVQAGVTTERIAANAAVQQTSIEGNTIVQLGAQKAAVENNQISSVNSQIEQILQHSKHASQDLTAFAPIVAEETGQGASAGSLAAANAQSRVASSTGATVSAVSSGITSILAGLFA